MFRKYKILVSILISVVFLSQPVFGLGATLAQEAVRFSEENFVNHFPDELIFRVDISSGVGELVSAKFVYSFESYYSSASYSKEAIEMPPGTELSLEYVLDTRDMTTPPMMPITYYWDVVDANGQHYESEPKTIRYEDIRYAWDILENEDVHVLWHDRPASFGESVFSTANEAVVRQRALFETDLTYPIYIVIYNTAEEFTAWHNIAHDWVGGESFGNYGITAQIVEDTTSQDSWLSDVIPHEISHLYFAQLTDNPTVIVPTWLNEGVAQYNEFSELGWVLDDVRSAAQTGEIIPLASLENGFGAFNRDRVYLSYAEALSAVAYFMERYGSDELSALLAAYKDGQATEKAFESAIGINFAEFQEGWFVWIGMPADFATNTPWALPTFAPSPTMGVSSKTSPPTTPKPALPCASVGVVFAALVSSGLILKKAKKRRDDE